jgi:hypothetical protein
MTTYKFDDFTIMQEEPSPDDQFSNVYCIDALGKLKWRAELPSQDDCYPNPLRFSQSEIVTHSFRGIRVVIDPRNGKIMSKSLAK